MRPQERIAFKRRNVPTPSTSAVYSDISKETCNMEIKSCKRKKNQSSQLASSRFNQGRDDIPQHGTSHPDCRSHVVLFLILCEKDS